MPMAYALAKSLNNALVDLSLKVGRDKVIEMANRLGVPGVKKTCSMALGDGGMTVLEHTGAYAAFAHGGKLSRLYGVLELFNSKGELVYLANATSRRAQVVAPRVAEQMNQMLQLVVTDGTGKRAQLDFMHVAGKTGTSSSYRDAWFVGYTGQLVAGVWMGNDDFRPMHNATGGLLPAQAWHSLMSVAHSNMNIPTIPGLTPHPTQVEEQQRLAELKKAIRRQRPPAPTTARNRRASCRSRRGRP